MNILLDTHISVWIITDDDRLSKRAREILTNPKNSIYVSAISALEVDMKIKSKHNNLPFTLSEYISMCRESKFIPLPMKDTVIDEANHLDWNGPGDVHKDPFDRMLLAQAIVEEMQFMTADSKIPCFKQDCVVAV